MKKSGTTLPAVGAAGPADSARSGRSRSAEAVIAPECHQIAPQMLADRRHLVTEATTQSHHDLLVGRVGLAEDQTALNPVQSTASRPIGCHSLDRLLHRAR